MSSFRTLSQKLSFINQSSSSDNKRIIAFDLLRGLLLLNILINHIELYPNGYDFFTGRGRMFVSAAEGFFFISGLLVGMVYRNKIGLGTKFIFKKMWLRAIHLYILAVITTLGFSYWALATHNYYIKDDALWLGQSWVTLVKYTLLLRYSFGWADFLTHFAIYMFFAPIAFYLLIKKKWPLVLGASLLVWLHRGESFAAAWQIIFFSGMVIGYYWGWLKKLWLGWSAVIRINVVRVIFGITAITFGISYASTYVLLFLNEHFANLPIWLQHTVLNWNDANEWVWQYFQKWTMEPGRILLFFIWFSALYMIVARYQRGIDRRSLGIIKMIGQNSLFFYIIHSFIVFVLKLIGPSSSSPLLNFTITSFILVLIITITALYVRYFKLLKNRIFTRFGNKGKSGFGI